MKTKKKKEAVLKRLLPYAGKKAVLLYLSMLLSAISGVMVLMPMVYIHKMVSSIILSGQVDEALIHHDAICAATFAGAGLLAYGIAIITSHIFAFEVEENIIKMSTKKLMMKPLGYFKNHESGKIRNIIVDGAAQTHSFLAHQLPDMAMTMITPIVLLIFFFAFDWKLGLASLIPMAIGMALMSTMMTKSMKKMRDDYFMGLANLSSETVEYVRGIPVVKTFAQSVESFDRLYGLIVDMKKTVMKMTMSYKNKMSIFEAVTGSTAFFLIPAAILFLFNHGDIRTVLANSVIYFLIGPAFGIFIMRSATIAQYTYFAETALNKINDVLDYEELTYGDISKAENGLTFKNVSFSYDDKKVVDNVSFTIKKGETLALVGPSGGGKTTLARLAARFYDVDEGEILIGGTNIKYFEKEALMKQISFVFQNARLFKMSLRDNLLLGKPDATEKELQTALSDAGALEIIQDLKDGLDTVYGKKGTYFSGGQAQRLAIARAFLKDADMVILDEATAFTDPENEHIIQASLKKLAKDKTTLMIAHRLSTIVDADKILVVDHGKIVEEGTHEALLAMNGMYKALWDDYQRSIDWKIGGAR